MAIARSGSDTGEAALTVANQVLDQGVRMYLRSGYPDRRRKTRGITLDEPTRGDAVDRVIAAYRDLPGLVLWMEQAARLFSLPRQTCEAVMNDLVRRHLLRRDQSGRYVVNN